MPSIREDVDLDAGSFRESPLSLRFLPSLLFFLLLAPVTFPRSFLLPLSPFVSSSATLSFLRSTRFRFLDQIVTSYVIAIFFQRRFDG